MADRVKEADNMYLFGLRMQGDSDAMEAVFLRANNEKCTDKNRLAVVLAQTDMDVFVSM